VSERILEEVGKWEERLQMGTSVGSLDFQSSHIISSKVHFTCITIFLQSSPVLRLGDALGTFKPFDSSARSTAAAASVLGALALVAALVL
jgi:hypothetical protein